MDLRLVNGLYFNFDVRVSKKLHGQDCLFDDIKYGVHFAQRRKDQKEILQ